MRRVSIISAVLVLLVVVSACSAQPAQLLSNTLQAIRSTPKSLDGSDPAWTKAPVSTIKTAVIDKTKATTPVDVKAQALYAQNDIWFRFEWADASESTARLWTYDGKAWKKSGNEDRIALYWQITPVAQFGTKGCAVLCHNEGDDPNKWYMITPKEGDRADNWHWKAARSNPVGYMDDKWLTGKLEDPADLESANHSDQKTSGGTSGNATKDGKAPGKTQSSDKAPSLGPTFLLASEAVDLDVIKLKPGAQIPAYLLSKPVGSQGDIETKGVYADGKWVVVMHRMLDTGHDDDVQFNTARSYPFGLAVFDNSGGANHTVAQEALTLQFK